MRHTGADSSGRVLRTLMALLLVTGAGVAAAAADYTVAPDGSDANTGTREKPFATLLRARDAVREALRAAPGQAVTVNIRGGLYRVTETLELTAEDSGAEGAPVVWQAMPGERVTLIGGARLTDFRRVSDRRVLRRLSPAARANVLEIDLKAAGVTDLGTPTPVGGPQAQLICNNQYMPLARYPNVGQWLKTTGIPEGGTKVKTERDDHYGRWAYSDERPAHWADVSDLWVHGYWVYDWSDQYQRVQKLDLDQQVVFPEPPYHGYGYRKGQRFYFLNVLEELDSPGEWYLDRASGRLYLWPPCALQDAEIVFPELLQPMLALRDAHHVRVCGLTLEGSRDAAIIVNGGSHVEIAGCTIRNFGAGAAVSISGSGNGLRSCDLYHVAGTGVSLDGGDRQTLTPGGNYVENCEIHHAGQVFRTYHGAVQLAGVGNRIAHCYIHDLPHQGIGYSGNDHIIEYCDFTRIAQETGDVGVTYAAADWTYMGHEFRYNYFHNVHGPGQLGCFTIYPDLPCGGIHLHHNVIYDVDQVFHTNSGRAMLIENNLFLRCRGMSFSTWGETSMFKEGGAWKMVENLAAVHYDQPPYSLRYPALQQLAEDFAQGEEHILERQFPKGNVIRRNVSWGSSFLTLYPPTNLAHVGPEENVIADEVVFTGLLDGQDTSATYRNGDPAVAAEFGKRGNLIVQGDPGFGDLRTQDFRLTADSPGRRTGFEPIPFRHIGLRRDEYRLVLPVEAYAPSVAPQSSSFTEELVVRLLPTPHPRTRAVLRYTLDGSEPTAASPVYERPIHVTTDLTVKAAAFVGAGRNAVRSEVITATYRLLALEKGAAYLSDLPERDLHVYTPCWAKDRNYQGGPIMLGGHEYGKGILLHPDERPDGPPLGQVVYALDGDLGKAKHLLATIGIDDAMETYNKGSAAFIIEVCRNQIWQRVFESPVLKLDGPPLEVNVDIADAESLRLITTDGGDGIACDHAVWADVRLR